MQNNILYLKKEIEKIKTLFIEKKFETIIKKIETLLKKNPNQAILYNLMGLSYLELDQCDKAIQVWLSAIEIIPSDPSILCNIGIAYKKKNEPFRGKKILFFSTKS